MSQKIEKVLFGANGLTGVFDDAGNQVPELQKGWMELFLEYLEANGVAPTEVKFQMSDGRTAEPFRIPGGWNWRIK